MEELLQVGVISNTHGVRGEVKVFPTTDDVKRFKKLKTVLLETDTQKREMKIESVRFFKQFVILKFQGIDDMDAALPLKGKSLLVTRQDAVRLRKDEYFIADLIGLDVLDEAGEQLGVVMDVLQTGANDVYAVRMTDGRELLLPAIKECILRIEMEKHRMCVHVMDGLLDL
ncbi:MAG: ribosome maturation factor RimM [Lachnospiraceae bacterium]|nr:ribosome maturation factor RimM [Lachnospiraceae bacterium]